MHTSMMNIPIVLVVLVFKYDKIAKNKHTASSRVYNQKNKDGKSEPNRKSSRMAILVSLSVSTVWSQLIILFAPVFTSN
jgi:uncharacterized protein YqhQ